MMVFDHSEPPMAQEELAAVQVEMLGNQEEIQMDAEDMAAIQEEMLAGGQINLANNLQVPQEEQLMHQESLLDPVKLDKAIMEELALPQEDQLMHQESLLDPVKLDKAIKEELAIINEEDVAGEKVEQREEEKAPGEVDMKKKEEVTVAQKKLTNFLNVLDDSSYSRLESSQIDDIQKWVEK